MHRRQLALGTLMLCAGLALVWLGALATPAGGQAAASPTVGWLDAARPVRFHILAPSDRPEDQELKRQVRDALLPRLQALGQAAATAQDLAASLPGALPHLAAAAAEAVRRAGRDVPVRVEFDPAAPFAARTFGPLTLPAGRYPTLRVVLGAGAGHNWWCVLFPPLCFPEWVGSVEAVPGPAPAEEEGDVPALPPRAVAAAMARAGSPLVLDERQVQDLPVVARLALVRWLRRHGWLP